MPTLKQVCTLTLPGNVNPNRFRLKAVADSFPGRLSYTAKQKEDEMQSIFREKRRSPRSRVFLGGELLIGSQFPAVECHVKNISYEGASIVVESGALLPDRFDLVIRKTNERHHAVITRSNGRQFGIAYLSAANANRKWSSPAELRQTYIAPTSR
jgi:PilZ domain-containing protein